MASREHQASNSPGNGVACTWDLPTVLAEIIDCDVRVVSNVVRLLDDENTIPFIARYRKEQTKGMTPEKLREVKEQLDELREVQEKIGKVIVKIEKLGKLEPVLKTAILSSRNTTEVEHLYAPFKPSSKRSLAERARDCGLEAVARQILTIGSADLRSAINVNREGLTSLSEVEVGVRYIIADIIAKDKRSMDEMRALCKMANITLSTKQSKTSSKTKFTSSNKNNKNGATRTDVDKFEQYFDFRCSIKQIKPHQVLAVNRGESLKVLNVSVDVADDVRHTFMTFVERTYVPVRADVHVRAIIELSAEDGYKRLLLPLMIRCIRSELNTVAEKASISVFTSNLKSLLLTRPVRGKSILGIDPGFTNGCKYALISSSGKVENTGVIYLHGSRAKQQLLTETEKIKSLLQAYTCELVAIGNGVGCRETETFFSDCIKRSTFHPLAVVFCIVSESGASVYSASDEAAKELPDLDITVRGAVSIARRLQDPLAELVKIDPKNIGVGMYQHDVSNKKLQTSLDGVVEDCVSFVGVDVNVASETLLRHVAGIGASMAKKIISYRESNGSFINRAQLTSVPGLGPKTFKQCAGFLRVLPPSTTMTTETCRCEQQSVVAQASDGVVVGDKRKRGDEGRKKGRIKKLKKNSEGERESVERPQPNAFDATSIHPESYDIADRLLRRFGWTKNDIGSAEFTQTVQSYITSTTQDQLDVVAETLSSSGSCLRQILDGLVQPLEHDIREDNNQKPLFKSSITKMSDVKPGTILTGKVNNVTHFGAFIDIGVGKDALLHVSAIRPNLLPVGRKNMELGDVVEVSVKTVDVKRERIGLHLLRLVNAT